MRENTRGLKDGDASACVIVCSWTFVIEMAAIDNFSGSRVRAWNCGGHDRPVPGADRGFHMGIQNDGFASAQAGPQCFGGLARDHEGEAGGMTRVQMTPPNHSRIQAGPCRSLVGHVADDAHCTMLCDRQFLHSRQNTVREDNLAAHVLARVIRLSRSVAHVDQLRLHVGAVTVVREVDWIRLPISEKKMLGPDFPEPSFFDRPRQVRAHQAVMPGSIDRELLALSIGQAVLVRALQNELRCQIEIRGGRDAMQAGQVAQVLVGSSAARFISQRCPLANAEEGLLTKSREGSECQKEADQAAHKLTRIALTLRRANLRRKTQTYAQIDG